ncbi:chromatin modification protein KNAG_0J00710 [Huiozyma naganishii CBS 8797]|uniref:Transcription initiation factor TFIID subunit 9 n=1 Tax=Huiozyma naganishii (strain ATCC MYA-139 / BCRC 22969 / CBS 8797 / KCTC 17520 / NBRC 10181 / NCYC 3082 / Yp74L-3) TaxID=1071383 RepID=J7S9K0_HUIN7|nr:hypothetical protein KNAG_0J00710 [Kazachstania naganishii CBS 8797]CCK72154.1 hypothetical protein KNAG_0J00710 [Kazachstania naganishii CBS 8797]
MVGDTPQEELPRDVRLLHLLLASQAIHRYDERVPLQLMDFAHRYTRGVLRDAMAYRDYGGAQGTGTGAAGATSGGGPAAASGTTSATATNEGPSLEDVRLAIASRTQYQFKPTAPKELALQLAQERNKKNLPQVMGSWGVRLPPEKYCLNARD